MLSQTQADLLTRTTFRLDEVPSPLALGKLIGELNRVPGVLNAEVAPGTDRAIVAHDAAVTSASLMDAAERTGVRLKFLSDTRPTAAVGRAPFFIDARLRNLVAFVVVLYFVPTILGAINPRMAMNHLVLPMALGSLWAFVIGYMMFDRRPKHP